MNLYVFVPLIILIGIFAVGITMLSDFIVDENNSTKPKAIVGKVITSILYVMIIWFSSAYIHGLDADNMYMAMGLAILFTLFMYALITGIDYTTKDDAFMTKPNVTLTRILYTLSLVSSISILSIYTTFLSNIESKSG